MKAHLEHAYNVLVKAFFEGTLAAGSCKACAIGNLFADAQGGIIKKPENNMPFYNDFTCTTKNDIWGTLKWFSLSDKTAEQHKKERKEAIIILDKIGLTWDEVIRIEYTFENNTDIPYPNYSRISELAVLEDQYKGLCAVVDVLLELDGEKTDPAPYKAKFRQHPKLVTA